MSEPGTPTTVKECLQAACSALLRGDTAERDRLCARAKVLLPIERLANATQRVLSVDFYVTRHGVVISTKTMAKAAGAIQ